MVENLVEIELAYINTKHPDFYEAGLIHRALTGGDSTNQTQNKPKHEESKSGRSNSLNRTLVQRNDDNEPTMNGVHSSPYTSSAAIASPTIVSMPPLGDGVSKDVSAEMYSSTT
jgi:dynamin 1-like protein